MAARVLVLWLAVLLGGSVHAAAEDGRAIRWMLTGLPPKMMPEGPFRGMGYGEQQVAWLTRHLPQFDHRIELVTPVRLWHEMKSGRGICSIDIADLPEREEWAVFTRHRTSIPAYRVLLLKERVPEFAVFRDAAGLIDLDRLATSDRLVGVYVAGRHYLPPINAFIDNPARKIRIDSMIASTKIFEMVAGRRGDFSFANPMEMNYFIALSEVASATEKPLPALAMLGIKGADDQVHGHIACTRDPLGEQMVQAVDHLLDDEANWAEFFAPQRRWIEGGPSGARQGKS